MTAGHRRWLIGAAVLLLVVIVVAIGLIASGVFDPVLAGPRQWQVNGKQIAVPPQSRRVSWLAEEIPDSNLTIRVTGALEKGEKDSGYGLTFGDEENYFAVAVSPLGYLAIWESRLHTDTRNDSFLLPWQTWPHVKREHELNEIWVDISGEKASVRINREWLWEGEIGSKSRGIGLLGESFAETALFDFPSIELFAGTNR